MVRSAELLHAADRFAKHQGIPGFKTSEGWLDRFKQRHCISNRKAHGEIADADTRFIEDLRKDFLATIEKYNFLNLRFTTVTNRVCSGVLFLQIL